MGKGRSIDVELPIGQLKIKARVRDSCGNKDYSTIEIYVYSKNPNNAPE